MGLQIVVILKQLPDCEVCDIKFSIKTKAEYDIDCSDLGYLYMCKTHAEIYSPFSKDIIFLKEKS